MIHSLSQEILNFSMYMLGCKVALEQDLSIGAIFRRKNYLYVPLTFKTGIFYQPELLEPILSRR